MFARSASQPGLASRSGSARANVPARGSPKPKAQPAEGECDLTEPHSSMRNAMKDHVDGAFHLTRFAGGFVTQAASRNVSANSTGLIFALGSSSAMSHGRSTDKVSKHQRIQQALALQLRPPGRAAPQGRTNMEYPVAPSRDGKLIRNRAGCRSGRHPGMLSVSPRRSSCRRPRSPPEPPRQRRPHPRWIATKTHDP